MRKAELVPTRFVLGDQDDRDAHVVEYHRAGVRRRLGAWSALIHGLWSLGQDGSVCLEPQPSDRTEEWLALHRYPMAATAVEALRAYKCDKKCFQCRSQKAMIAKLAEQEGKKE